MMSWGLERNRRDLSCHGHFSRDGSSLSGMQRCRALWRCALRRPPAESRHCRRGRRPWKVLRANPGHLAAEASATDACNRCAGQRQTGQSRGQGWKDPSRPVPSAFIGRDSKLACMMLDQALRRWVCGPHYVTCPAVTLPLGKSDILHAIKDTQTPGRAESTVGTGVRARHPHLSQSASRRPIALHPKAILPDIGVPDSIDPSQLAAQSTLPFDITEENRIYVT